MNQRKIKRCLKAFIAFDKAQEEYQLAFNELTDEEEAASLCVDKSEVKL